MLTGSQQQLVLRGRVADEVRDRERQDEPTEGVERDRRERLGRMRTKHGVDADAKGDHLRVSVRVRGRGRGRVRLRLRARARVRARARAIGL